MSIDNERNTPEEMASLEAKDEQEAIAAWMEGLKYERLKYSRGGRPGWRKLNASGKHYDFLDYDQAAFFYRAQMAAVWEARHDELHEFIAGGKSIYHSSSYSIDGPRLAARLEELALH